MLLETIRCEQGIPAHLEYHQRRLERSLTRLGVNAEYSLKSLIVPPDNSLYRCRFLYDENGCRVEYHPYIHRKIRSLTLIHDDKLEYSLKSADRSALDRLYLQRGNADDVLIVKNDLLSDTTIANIALQIGGRWFTPKTPLLEGTTRARLIDEQKLFCEDLEVSALRTASKIALMNAMAGFYIVENGIIGEF